MGALMKAPQMYYIQHRGFCGNCLFWWSPDGHGYTCNLDAAWKVTREEAHEICKSRPKEDIPWLVTKANGKAQRHVVAMGSE
jgi:hypothetical protein